MNNANLVLLAMQYYGQAAIPGGKSNPVVIGFFQKAGHYEIKDDDIPWCSAFMNTIAQQAGAPSSGSLMARSWLEIGKKVDSPKFGDVVIFWRDKPDGVLAHVGLVVAAIGEKLWVLGGNQNNEVRVSMYTKERVLGYRRLFDE